MRRALVAVVAAFSLIFPAGAQAHGLVGKADLPVPEWLFGWAAAVVLVITFVALAALWPTPRLQNVSTYKRLFRWPVLLDFLFGLVGVLLFLLTIYSGFAGTQVATANFAPTFIYVIFWVGLVPASLLFGDVFRSFNPWLAVARGFSWVLSRVNGGDLPEALPYPKRLGYWPAVVGLVAFGWLELVYSGRDTPSTLALIALIYAAIQWLGMGLYGIQAWSTCGDAFGVYFNLFARIGAVCRREGVLALRKPLTGLTRIPEEAGLVALLCVMIGVTVFDGASEGPLWTEIAPKLQSLFEGIGFSTSVALQIAFTIGLIVGIAFVASIYWLAIRGVRTVAKDYSLDQLARQFAHTLVPIAFAYIVAHYFSLFAYQGQAILYLGSDPLGNGANYLGFSDRAIDYSIISATGIWYVQVGVLIVGHVLGVILAHDRAISIFKTPRQALRSQYWMLAVMVGFTALGLWLLSAANQ